jgi:hypothetical protein
MLSFSLEVETYNASADVQLFTSLSIRMHQRFTRMRTGTRRLQQEIAIPPSKKKVKISLLQALEAPRVARGRGSHIT